MNRLIAIGCLAGIAAYFRLAGDGRAAPRTRTERLKVVLPSARLTLVQVLIGVVDLGFCALAMYLLMPTEPYIDLSRWRWCSSWRRCSALPAMRRQSRRVERGDAGGVAAVQQGTTGATLVVFRILYFLIPSHLDFDHGGARTLAQRGAALAGTPPAQRSLHGGGAGAAAGQQPPA